MSSVTNLLPAIRTVALGRAAVAVSGLSLRKLTELVVRYPQLLGFVAGNQIEVAALIANGSEIALAIFAVGFVGPVQRRWWHRASAVEADEDMLAAFDRASAGQQIDIVGTIIDLTFKGERVGPFLDMLTKAAAPVETAPATSEPSTPDSSSS